MVSWSNAIKRKVWSHFLYNLITSHSFAHVRISSKWEVILECGEGVKLDAPGDIGFVFNGDIFRNIPVAKFMEDMKRRGKVIESENKKSESAPKDDLEEKESEKAIINDGPLTEQNEREVDWEERHFRICLALISKTDISNGRTNNIVPAKIIRKADEMAEALKKHYQVKKL